MSQFKFYDLELARDGLLDSENDSISDDLLQAHTDPFYNECRAYGRLEEAKLNGKWAIRCHGYVMLLPEIEAQLKRYFKVEDWNRFLDEYRKPVALRRPIQAIVEDLVLEDKPIIAKIVDKLLKYLRKMRSKGVYAQDLHERNYRGGLLMDFSCARRRPHFYSISEGRTKGEGVQIQTCTCRCTSPVDDLPVDG